MIKYKDMLFSDFKMRSEITQQAKEKNLSRVFTGGVRINNGMYRTDEEDRKYRENSLKRKLPS